MGSKDFKFGKEHEMQTLQEVAEGYKRDVHAHRRRNEARGRSQNTDAIEELAQGLGSQLPEINGTSRNAAFPASLSMYNLGIKSTKLQHTTLESVKYLANMKTELQRAIQDTAVNKKQQEQLSQPSTEYYIHKNLIEMKTLFGEKDPHHLKEGHPDVFAGQLDPQDTNFAEKYEKLATNTKFRKEMEQSETIQPESWSHEADGARRLGGAG